MRVIVYGAGAVGGNLGGRLARIGRDVVLIARQRQVDAIRQNGLKMVMPTGTEIVRLEAVLSPREISFRPDDMVWLCVKGQDTEAALRDLKEQVDDVAVFCFQNGVLNEPIAAKYFRRVYGVAPHVGSVFLNPGEVMARRDPPGSLIMGRYPKGKDETVEAAAALGREAGYLAHVLSDVMAYKWGGMLTDSRHVVGAITNEQADAGDNRLTSEALVREAKEILRDSGIQWMTREQLREEWPEEGLPPKSVTEYEAINSMWQSLARQLGAVESDCLNGEIVRLAAKLGRRAPVNETLLRISQEMAAQRELPGKYTPSELRRLAGLA